MTTVKSATTIKYVKQGDTLSCSLRSTLPLKQFVPKSTGAAYPDYTVSANQPCIYPVIRSSLTASRVQPTSNSDTWYFGGTQIPFDSNGMNTSFGGITAGTFKREWKSIDGDFQVPTLTIKRNIASSSVITSKVIRMDCTVNTGFAATVSQEIELEIEQTDGDAFMPYITVNDGGVIDEDTTQLTLEAHLLVAGIAITSGVTYAWKKMVVTAGVDTWSAIAGANSGTLVVGSADIDNKELYKVVMTYVGKTAEATMELTDETDDCIIYPNPTDGSGNTVPEEISSSQTSITYAPFVCYRGETTHLTGYTFYFALTKSDGVIIASADAVPTFMVTKAHAEAANGDLTLITTATR